MTKSTLAATPDGHVLIPSAQRNAKGEPRFNLVVAQNLMNDLGVKHLIQQEVFHGGFEMPARNFFDRHLTAGDVFMDVGAHMGMFTLSAATAAPQVRVVAMEPHPVNLHYLIKSVHANQLQDRVNVVAAAADEVAGLVKLNASQGTMGSSLLPHGEQVARASRAAPLYVPAVSLDDVVAATGNTHADRFFLKVDVEGVEPRVLSGGRALIESGKVAAMLVEKGSNYDDAAHCATLAATLDWLAGLGFSFHRFDGDRQIPYTLSPGLTDILCLSPALAK
ncbi:MAG: FkbM family methyltransferase [Rhodospirillaceae bacterium]|nr:FkbM family methyltransferase [Rhodospirillales bacterium]